MTTNLNDISYFSAAFDPDRRQRVIRFAREAQQRLRFDTLAVTGVSGTLMGGVVAHALGCSLLVVRKDDDISTHSSKRIEGHLGERWAFLDDLVDSGATRRRVKSKVREAAYRRELTTRFVGSVLYQSEVAYNGRDEHVWL